ncbi:MAG: invasion associated locus B family protein [Alphaproteobacteria bacterium]
MTRLIRFLPLCLALVALPALAQQRPAQPAQPSTQAAGPRQLGTFRDWTAATHQENGQKICYALTRASKTEPNRQGVVLTVTHRPGGRDSVAITAGYAYPRNAEVTVAIGPTNLPFYTGGNSAFARDGAAVVAAMRGGNRATARGPAAGGRGTANDQFSLAGFSAAHDAISRECPARR